MTELKLKKGVPVQVTPTGSFTVVQNSMTTIDDMLKVSSTGNIKGKWMKVRAGGAVKFAEPLFLMQDSWDTVVFPVVEGS